MPTNNEINTIEVMDEKELYEQYGYEPDYDDMPDFDPNSELVEDEYPECEVTFADAVMPVAFKDAVVAPEAVEEKETEQAAENSETQEAEASDKEAQAAAIAELLARTDGAPELYDSVQSLFTMPKKEWMLQGLLLCSGVTLLTGESYDGKSLTAMDMAVALISGQPWCGKQTEPTSVFYHDYDSAKTINGERLKAICNHRGIPDSDAALRRFHFASADRLSAITAKNPLTPDFIARSVVLSPDVQETKRALIIIDTLRTFCDGVDLKEETDMTPVMRGFQRCLDIIGKCGIKASILVLHHYRKNTAKETQCTAKTFDKKITATLSYADDKTMGSGALKAIADIAAHILTDPTDRHHKGLILTKNKADDRDVQRVLEMYFDGTYDGDTLVDFGIAAMERPFYSATSQEDDSDTPAPRYNSHPQKAAAVKINYDERVLQYVSENPGIGRFALRNSGIVNTNLAKSIIDRLLSEGKLVEGASAGSARKGQGLYVA